MCFKVELEIRVKSGHSEKDESFRLKTVKLLKEGISLMQFTEESVSQRDLMRFSDVFMADPAGES